MDYLITLLADPAAWIALATMIVIEVVLGIDNLIEALNMLQRQVRRRRAGQA